jgi:hypothetical protein
MVKKLCSMTAASRGSSDRRGPLSSEKGVVLVIVIVLSAVALVFMTALIYMITSGTRVSGLQKRYKTALDAGVGGGNAFYQLIETRAEESALLSLATNLNAAGLVYSRTTPTACTGSVEGALKQGLAAKLLTNSSSWNTTTCDDSLNIDPAVSSTYDMKVELGTDIKYNVFVKIVETTVGNTGGDPDLSNIEVDDSNKGIVDSATIPYFYAVEVVSENSARIDERAKLSILYEY